jgi:cyclophilin family peptidyl-prolyl cis-trans isomerase
MADHALRLPLHSLPLLRTPPAGKHVVFGRVLENYSLVDRLQRIPTDRRSGRPLQRVTIADCGELA